MNFLDSLNQMVQDAINEDIKDHLLDQWVANHADEGEAYLEWQVVGFADDTIKAQYNEYYDLTPVDEYYYEVN